MPMLCRSSPQAERNCWTTASSSINSRHWSAGPQQRGTKLIIRGGARDDCANAAAGALVAAADRTNEVTIVGGWGVFTAPRRDFSGSIGGTAEDAAYRAAMFGIPYGMGGDS
jgi:hypothetical protein